MKALRKWINLSESLQEARDHWYSDGDVALWFPESGIDDDGDEYHIQGDWFELLGREVSPSRQLALAQDFFQLHVMDEHKPAWITDMEVRGEEEEYFWKIESGVDDPDEY